MPIALHHATSPELLNDSDTSVLLQAIRQRHSPFSWFAGDWPLQNHFYRPVATLAFEWDNRLYGNNPVGYGWTNAILCILCVLLLLWFVRELTERPVFAGASAVLFASWQWAGIGSVSALLDVAMWSLLAVGIWRHRGRVSLYLPLFFAIAFLQHEVVGRVSLDARMIGWLPGRTASVMSVFALISLASYARYERLSAERRASPPITPLTPPATRNTVIKADRTSGGAWVWILISALSLALALASYEQAVMIPAALAVVAFSLSLQGLRPRWKLQILFGGVLVVYGLLRHAVVPSAPSGYQLQQFRHGPGVWLSLADYVLPFAGLIPSLSQAADPQLGLFVLVTPVVTGFFWQTVETIAAIWILRKQWILCGTGWVLSWLTYSPMAWLKQFDHYHYLPLAMRSVFVVGLGWAVWEAAAIASRPQARQAPKRLAPAPGSLARP